MNSSWESTLDDMAGTPLVTNNDQILTIVHVDAGIMAPDITTSGPGVGAEK
jgi:hypothetical protein